MISDLSIAFYRNETKLNYLNWQFGKLHML